MSIHQSLVVRHRALGAQSSSLKPSHLARPLGCEKDKLLIG